MNTDNLTVAKNEGKKLKVLELFAGTRSIGKAFEARGHEVYSIEWNKQHENIDLYEDIAKVTAEFILENFGQPDIIWASPDCTTYSIAGISHHREKTKGIDHLEPTSKYAKQCDITNQHVLNLIETLKPKYYFIENPQGGMKKMDWMQPKVLPLGGGEIYKVTYCQYGDTRMKPTNLWTNHPNPKFKAPCKNGMPCHVAAPRGSATGTQGIKGTIDRSRIPEELCNHIAAISEE